MQKEMKRRLESHGDRYINCLDGRPPGVHRASIIATAKTGDGPWRIVHHRIASGRQKKSIGSLACRMARGLACLCAKDGFESRWRLNWGEMGPEGGTASDFIS